MSEMYWPNELVLHVGKFLDVKTMNAMRGANRRFEALVARNQNILPRGTVKITIEYRRSEKILELVVATSKRQWTSLFTTDCRESTRERQMHLVEEFYQLNTEASLTGTEQTFAMGITNGLRLHLVFLLGNVLIVELKLERLYKKQLKAVVDVLTEHRSQIPWMLIDTDRDVPKELVEMTTRKLEILNGKFPRGIFAFPSVRKLDAIKVNECNRNSLDGESLLGISARTVWYYSNAPSELTMQTIQDYITEWCKGRRVIKSVVISLNRPIAERDDWPLMFQSIDKDIVDFEHCSIDDDGYTSYFVDRKPFSAANETLFIQYKEDDVHISALCPDGKCGVCNFCWLREESL